MDGSQRRTLIITAAVGVLVLMLIIGAIYFLIRFISGRQSSNLPTASTEQNIPASSESGGEQNQSNNSGGNTTSPGGQTNTKDYSGSNFSLKYPSNFGLLTCNNSYNFEFDPENSQDQLKTACDYAVKPITVLVTENLSCQGENVKLGGKDVIRSSEGEKGGEVSYRWCVVNPNGYDLDITHRVSNSNAPASSKKDAAKEVEQMISSISFK